MAGVRLTSLLLFLTLFQIHEALRFANYIQDHMVLQRAPQRAIVWGFGEPGALTSLHLNGKIYRTFGEKNLANDKAESIWTVTLDPVTEEGPFNITVDQKLSNGTVLSVSIEDILFGDVWVCSGQSNMQMSVVDIYNGTIEIANAGNYPKIRVYTNALKASSIPVEEVMGIEENWSVASPKSIGGPSFGYMSAVCWLYGRTIHEALGGRPIGLIATSWGGTAVELWMSPPALKECGITKDEQIPLQDDGISNKNVALGNSQLYNSMLHPFTRIVIYGAIWYQGEANTGFHTDLYACTFSKMIESWREEWLNRTNGQTDPQFPFGFVQLSTDTSDQRVVGGFPEIRWHQTFDVGYVPNNVVPRVFMAVALDLRDDIHGIHPKTKHDVGYRLSRSGLAVAYNQQVEFQGPIVSDVSYTSGSNTITLTYGAVQALNLRSTAGFEVCCQGAACANNTATDWVSSPILGVSGLKVTVAVNSTCEGKALYGLRYLWHETPCPFKGAALYSSTDLNLPSPPYWKVF